MVISKSINMDTTVVITPIAKAYKPAGTPDSRRDYEHQQARVYSGNDWMWDDAPQNESKEGGYFGFVFNGNHVVFHKITRTATPEERLPMWAENVGQGNRKVLFLSINSVTLTWEEWTAMGGAQRVMGTMYPRNMNFAQLNRSIESLN